MYDGTQNFLWLHIMNGLEITIHPMQATSRLLFNPRHLFRPYIYCANKRLIPNSGE